MPRALYPRESDPIPFAKKAGYAPGQVWTDAENFAPTRIQSPDRAARSKSLYRLRIPAHQGRGYFTYMFIITALHLYDLRSMRGSGSYRRYRDDY